MKSIPAFTVTGDVIERVTATSAASTPLSVNTRLRITAGLTPQSWAPSSSWITERTALPVVAKRKNAASTRADGQRDRRRQQAAGAHPDAEDLDGVAADAQAECPDRVAPHEEAVDDDGHAEHEQQAEQHPRLAPPAVHRSHQREIEEQTEGAGGDEADKHGDERR